MPVPRLLLETGAGPVGSAPCCGRSDNVALGPVDMAGWCWPDDSCDAEVVLMFTAQAALTSFVSPRYRSHEVCLIFQGSGRCTRLQVAGGR